MEPTDLSELVGEVIELMKPRAAELQIALQTSLAPDLPPAPVDAEAIHRVVLNLVNNAIDAVDGRDEATVRVETALGQDGRSVAIVVSDNGVGIPADKLGEVFKPFFSTKGSRGTGLGLAVSRKTVREHGGDITVTSTPDVGSAFIVRLDTRRDQADENGPPQESPPPN
jgi:signal transduction histidine kinase